MAKRSPGFTLIELSIVVFIIGLIAAVAFPRFLPIIVFSQLEGAGRHVANFSRTAIAQAEMMKDDITLYFDLDKQEFWVTKMVYPDPNSAEGEGEDGAGADQMGMLSQFASQGGYSPAEMSKLIADAKRNGGGGMLSGAGLPPGFDLDSLNSQVGDKFDRMARRQLEARAQNVIQDEGITSSVGPLFDKQFSLDGNGEDAEPYEEEITDPVLKRSQMPSEVSVTDIFINGQRRSKGIVDIPISPLGLEDNVVFYITNQEGNVYSVIWDPILNNVDIFDGKAKV